MLGSRAASSGSHAVRGWILQAAADRQQQRDPGQCQGGAQIDLLAALIEHLGLRVEHRQVAGQPRAVTLFGQSVGFFGGGERLALLSELVAQRIDEAELIGSLVGRTHHGVIVIRHRLVEPRLAAAVLRAQAASVEQRQ